MKLKFLSSYPTKFNYLSSSRKFWQWLNPVFNSYDKDRVQEVGKDRACTEWLLRNGAACRFESNEDWLRDYNLISSIFTTKTKIVEVDATDSSISHYGFRYFENLNIISLKLHRCDYIQDAALNKLNYMSFLKFLQVSSCANVTDNGILALSNIKGLEKLYMYDVIGVRDRQKCVDALTANLPQCTINFPWANESEKQKSPPPSNQKK